jgi:hypothetical protein
LEASTAYATVNLALSFVVNQVHIRMQAKMRKVTELDALSKHGASFDEMSGDLLIPSLTSSRCFLFRLDPLYPIGGMASAQLTLIEVAEEGEDLQAWNDKLKSFNSITDVHSLLI